MEGSIVSNIHWRPAPPAATSTRDTGQHAWQPRLDTPDAPSPARQVAITLLRRKWFILGFALAGGALAGLSALGRPPLYAASTQIVVDPAGTRALSAPGAAPQDPLDSTIDSHLTMLTSDAHLRQVLDALHSAGVHPAAAVPDRDPSKSPSFINDQLETVRTVRSSIVQFLSGLLSRGDKPPPTQEAAIAADLARLKTNLRVGQELRSRIISIGYTSRDPDYAARVANTIASTYVDQLARRSLSSQTQALASIRERLPAARSQLANAADQLEIHRLTHGSRDPAGNDTGSQEISQLSRQISFVQADLAETTKRIDRLQALRSAQALRTPGASAADLAAAIGSPAPTDLDNKTVDAGANGAADETAPAPVAQALALLNEKASSDRAQLALLEQRQNTLKAAAADAASELSGLRALELKVDVASRRYNDLLTRQQELTQQIESPARSIAIWSEAWPPTQPTTLSSAFLIPPGMVVFGTLGAMIAILRRKSDHTVRGEAEAEQALGIPCIGLLPKTRSPRARQLSRMLQTEPKSVYTRALRSLLISLAAPDGGLRLPNILLIASSDRQEGKTTLAWSIALTAARLGERVLFIDLDQKGSTLTNGFRDEFTRVPTDATFADFLTGACPLSDTVEEMPDIGIDYMPAPDISCDLLPLMVSADSSRLIDPLRQAYTAVIIDGPTGLAAPEAMLLTSWADAVLFVVRWGATDRNLARSALESLSGNAPYRPPPVVSVLTQVNLRKHAGYRFGDSGDLLLAGPR